VKRFAFRGTLEERICRLHEQMHDGQVAINNGILPGKAVDFLHGVRDRPL